MRTAKDIQDICDKVVDKLFPDYELEKLLKAAQVPFIKIDFRTRLKRLTACQFSDKTVIVPIKYSGWECQERKLCYLCYVNLN